MGRPREHRNSADKQQAYRDRKRHAELDVLDLLSAVASLSRSTMPVTIDPIEFLSLSRPEACRSIASQIRRQLR